MKERTLTRGKVVLARDLSGWFHRTPTEIADYLGVSLSSAYKAIQGETHRSIREHLKGSPAKSLPEGQIEEVISLVQAGNGKKNIIAATGLHEYMVRRLLNAYAVDQRMSGIAPRIPLEPDLAQSVRTPMEQTELDRRTNGVRRAIREDRSTYWGEAGAPYGFTAKEACMIALGRTHLTDGDPRLGIVLERNARLTKEQVARARRERFLEGRTVAGLTKDAGVSESTLCRALAGATYEDMPIPVREVEPDISQEVKATIPSPNESRLRRSLDDLRNFAMVRYPDDEDLADLITEARGGGAASTPTSPRQPSRRVAGPSTAWSASRDSGMTTRGRWMRFARWSMAARAFSPA